MEISHFSRPSLTPARPVSAPAKPRAARASGLAADHFVASLRSPATSLEPEAPREGEKAAQLAKLANLSHLPHMLHVLGPVASVAKGVSGASKAVSIVDKVADLVSTAKRVTGAAKALSHADDLVDAATAAKGASGLARAAGASAPVGFVARMGGSLSAIATVLSSVVAFIDIKKAIATRHDPEATAREKTVTTLQAGLSGVSGAAGLVAALAAAGLALPVSIPALLSVSSVAGLGSFAVSLIDRLQNRSGR